MGYLQVNALSEWIIGIYLHEFTNNEREISIPHEAAEFIVSERVQLRCLHRVSWRKLMQSSEQVNNIAQITAQK